MKSAPSNRMMTGTPLDRQVVNSGNLDPDYVIGVTNRLGCKDPVIVPGLADRAVKGRSGD